MHMEHKLCKFFRSRIEEKHLNANERSGRTGGVHMPHHIADKYRYLQARTAFLQVTHNV